MKFLLPYKLMEDTSNDKIERFLILNPWLYKYKQLSYHIDYRLKEKYKEYLKKKYNVNGVRLTVNYDGLVLNLIARDDYDKDFKLDRNSLMPLITEFKKYNWEIEVSSGTLMQAKEFVIKMTNNQMKKFFDDLDEEIEIKGSMEKYNL